MADFTGGACPWCKAAFVPGDEVVICPGCNSPQHKSCREQRQACAVCGSEAAYINPGPGTALCAACGAAITEGQSFCPGCGAPKSEPSPGPRICGKCGAEVAADFAFCPRCGRSMEELSAEPHICPGCGAEVGSDFDFCPKCGNKMKEDETEQATESEEQNAEEKKSKKDISTTVIIIVVIISLFACFAIISELRGRQLDAKKTVPGSASASTSQSAAELKEKQLEQLKQEASDPQLKAKFISDSKDYVNLIQSTNNDLSDIITEITNEGKNIPEYLVTSQGEEDFKNVINRVQVKEASKVNYLENTKSKIDTDYANLSKYFPVINVSNDGNLVLIKSDEVALKDAYSDYYQYAISPYPDFGMYSIGLYNEQKNYFYNYNNFVEDLKDVGG